MATLNFNTCNECSNLSVKWDTPDQSVWAVKCKECGTKTEYYDSMGDAIEHWNLLNKKTRRRSKKQ